MSVVVPFYSAAAAHQGLDLRAALERVLDSHWYVLGREVRAFEEEFATYCGVPHCVSVANGTDALELALRALEVEAGAEVLCTANAAFYASTAALAVGAQPRYVDVDPASLCMDPAALDQALARRRPAAVIVTHLYGQLADVAAIAATCRRHDVPWIEDCAQAHGARRDGRLAGAFGDLACFSFYPTKNLGALGDGGAVLTADAARAERLRSLRQYGWTSKYHVQHAGGRNSRLDELQAAVLRTKLPALDRQNAERRAIAERYAQAFAGLPLQLPVSTGEDFAAHLYVVRTPQRDALRGHLQACEIGHDVHYPVPDHQQPVMREAQAGVRLPHTESACGQVLSLPCQPGLGESAVQAVIDAVRGFFAKGAAC